MGRKYKPADEIVSIGTACAAGMERAFEKTEADRPGLARRCLPFGVRLLAAPHEQAVIVAMRYARFCGRSGRWIADSLNSRGVLHRGKPWTARAVCRILRGAEKGTGGDGDDGILKMLLDDLEKFADFVKKK